MIDTTARTHHLDITGSNRFRILYTVAMSQIPFQRNGNYFHIFMWMSIKSHRRVYTVIIQHSQGSEMDSFRIVIVSKTECVVGFEPAMIKIAS